MKKKINLTFKFQNGRLFQTIFVETFFDKQTLKSLFLQNRVCGIKVIH